jgi:hypothetical protein
MTIRQRRTAERFFVDNAIIDEFGDQLSPYGLAVYVALCRHADIDSQECYPSHSTLAKETGMGEASVKKAVRKLEDLGLVRVSERWRENGGQTSNLYTLLAPPSHHRYPTPVSPDDGPRVATDTPSRCHQATTNNPKNEQSSINIPPGGGKVEIQETEEPGEHREDEDLTPVTHLQKLACHTFNRNGQFANKTQRKQFLALEHGKPDAYLEELISWANGKSFKAFVSAVKNPNNYSQWQERQACRLPKLKEIQL